MFDREAFSLAILALSDSLKMEQADVDEEARKRGFIFIPESMIPDAAGESLADERAPESAAAQQPTWSDQIRTAFDEEALEETGLLPDSLAHGHLDNDDKLEDGEEVEQPPDTAEVDDSPSPPGFDEFEADEEEEVEEKEE
jgi:hypothetical protein